MLRVVSLDVAPAVGHDWREQGPEREELAAGVGVVPDVAQGVAYASFAKELLDRSAGASALVCEQLYVAHGLKAREGEAACLSLRCLGCTFLWSDGG